MEYSSVIKEFNLNMIELICLLFANMGISLSLTNALPMQIIMDNISPQEGGYQNVLQLSTSAAIPSIEDEMVPPIEPRPDGEIQCIRHHEYAIFVNPEEVSNFYSGNQLTTLRTFVNEKGKLKYYFCTPCTVCGSGVRILTQCHLRQDTVCSTACLNKTLMYDDTLMQCVSLTKVRLSQIINDLVKSSSSNGDDKFPMATALSRREEPTRPAINVGLPPQNKSNKWKKEVIPITVGVLTLNIMVAALLILKRRELKKKKVTQRLVEQQTKRQNQNNRRDQEDQGPPHTVIDIESQTPPSAHLVIETEAANTLNSTTCRTKESNLNQYVQNLQPAVGFNPEIVQSNIHVVSEPKITVMSGTPPYWLEMSGTFGPRGGELSCDESDVVVQIPPGAIPTSHPNQLIVVKVSKTLEHFSLDDLPEDAMFLSPLVDCESPGLKRFNKDILIKLPHRAKLSPHWKFTVHFTDSSSNDQKWNTVSGAMNIEHKISEPASDVNFSLDEKFVKISTPHFSKYTCSGCGGKKRQLSLESVLYAKHTNLHETGSRVDLRCYILDTIKDCQTKVNRNEHLRPHSEHKPLAVDVGGKEAELQLALVDMGEHWQWNVDEYIHKRIQVVSLTDVVRCHSDAAPYHATFTLRPKHPHISPETRSLEAAVEIKQVTSRKAPSKSVTVEIALNLNEMEDYNADTEINSKDTPDMQEVFAFVAGKISADEWKPLYRKLMTTATGCPLNIEADISDIVNRYEKDIREQRYEALMRWLQKFGKHATLTRLCNCLRQVEMIKVAEDVEEKFAKGHKQVVSPTKTTCTDPLVDCGGTKTSLETDV